MEEGHTLRGREILWMVDNTAALGGVVKGTSGQPVLEKLSTRKPTSIMASAHGLSGRHAAKEDRGQVQAIVAEPGVLLVLEQLAAQLHQRRDWRCAAVCCTHTVATAVMRMGHLERTRFLRRTPSGYWLRAYRGKGRDSLGFRPAFDWFCPLLCTGFKPISPIQILHSVWDA